MKSKKSRKKVTGMRVVRVTKTEFELDNGDMIHLNDHIDEFFIESIPFNEALKMVKLNIRSKRIKKIIEKR